MTDALLILAVSIGVMFAVFVGAYMGVRVGTGKFDLSRDDAGDLPEAISPSRLRKERQKVAVEEEEE